MLTPCLGYRICPSSMKQTKDFAPGHSSRLTRNILFCESDPTHCLTPTHKPSKTSMATVQDVSKTDFTPRPQARTRISQMSSTSKIIPERERSCLALMRSKAWRIGSLRWQRWAVNSSKHLMPDVPIHCLQISFPGKNT